jgi:hypothetical protein
MPGIVLLATAATLWAWPHTPWASPIPWGAEGHEMAARAAVEGLPQEVPGFFREAGAQLAYLNPEPDRWRERSLAEMDQAWSYDHYIDLENVVTDVSALADPAPASIGALGATDRFGYLRHLYALGMERPERDGGLLPFRIVELYQRLVTEWRLWRSESDPQTKRWIEERIVADAGILGHYVTDASNPHHTTIHFNGWDADAPNPQGFTYDRNFHYRFESAFVAAQVGDAEVRARMDEEAGSVDGAARRAVLAHILEAHQRVDELYRLERDLGFDPDDAAHEETVGFAAERIAAGADMLRTLWWSAWLESASSP